MIRDRYDVIIIGAGPAGLRLAERLVPTGCSVAILDSKPNLEAISHVVLVPLKMLAEDGLLNTIPIVPCRGYIMHSLSFSHAFHSSEPSDCMVMTGDLLQAFGQRIGEAELCFGHRVTRIEATPDDVRLQVHTPDGIANCSATILAACDGAGSISNRSLGGGPPLIRAVEHHFDGVEGREGYFEAVHTHKYSPGFYVAMLNFSPRTVAVAIGSPNQNPRQLLEAFIAEHPAARDRKLAQGRGTHCFGGLCAVGKGIPRQGRILFLGDAAAGFPWMGGMTYEGARQSADAAWQPMKEALETKDITALQAYEAAWEETFGERYRRDERLRHAYAALTDQEVDDVFSSYRGGGLWKILVARAEGKPTEAPL